MTNIQTNELWIKLEIKWSPVKLGVGYSIKKKKNNTHTHTPVHLFVFAKNYI